MSAPARRLYRLSLFSQARAAGGRVHALIGNHEVMNLTGDLRYVSPREYAAFATTRSAELRDGSYAALADPARRDDPAYRQQWDTEHPLGWVEHRQAFDPTARYGRWIRRHNTVVKVNDSQPSSLHPLIAADGQLPLPAEAAEKR